MSKPIIPIIFATNNGYAPYAAVTVNSLVKNASDEYFYDIYVFHTELSEKNIELLESMGSEKYSVKCLCVERFIERESKYMYTNFHFSKEMFYRILIPTIFPQYSRAVYLDCDIVVLGDIAEFYNIDLEGNIIGGVNDIMHGRSKSYVSGELGIDPFRYINSGVLLIDCDAFRREGIKEKCFAELSVRQSLRYPDQDIINLACMGRIKFLHRKWNYIWHYHIVRDDPSLNLPENEAIPYMEAAKDIRILHYTSGIKPWKNKNVALSEHFWKYAEDCPFYDKIKQDFASIPSRSYIGYNFLDLDGDTATVTASLYTIEGMKYEDIILSVDGNECKTDYLYKHVIEIGGRTYDRSFFKFSVKLSELSDNARIVFYNAKTGIPMIIISAWTFPIDFTLATFTKVGSKLLYRCERALVFAAPTDENLSDANARHAEAIAAKASDPVYKKSLLVRRIYRMLRPFFKKDVWLISDRTDSAGDNGEAFFKYLSKKRPKGIKPVFVIDKGSDDFRRMKKYGKVVAAGSTMHQIYYLFATANISAHLEKATSSPIYCAPYLKDILAKCKTVFLQHGIIKDNLSFSYNRNKDNMSLFVTSARSEYESVISTPEYQCGPDITKLTGLPRYDYLENRDERIIFIVPTWRRSCLADLHTCEPIDTITDSAYFKFYDALLHNSRLIDAAKKNGYRLCFYPHPMMKLVHKDIGELDPIFADASKYTYNDVFCRGSLMLTDYSSTQFDFAYLRKPIVYTHFDHAEFFTSHSYSKGYFDYERDGFGEVVYNLEDTVNTLIGYIESGCELKPLYRERIDGFFAYNDKNNCDRLYEQIIKLEQA